MRCCGDRSQGRASAPEGASLLCAPWSCVGRTIGSRWRSGRTRRRGRGRSVVRVEACGVCRTDLHVVDGELPNPKLPIVPGHEIVGRVEAVGEGVGLKPGARVGAAWLAHTDGTCPYCRSGRENLCDAPLFTGYTRDGGYATHTIADADFVYPLSEDLDPVETAPLLCAGLIGWRSLKAGR